MKTQPLRLTLVTPPDKQPLTLNEVKLAARMDDDFTDDDAILTALIRVASEAFETYTGLSGISRTYRAFLTHWPRAEMARDWEGFREGPEDWLNGPPRDLELPRPPLQSVTHIKTYDDADAATTYAASNYFVDTASKPGRVVLRTGSAQPLPTRVANGIEIEFVAGYGSNPADLPEQARQGMSQLVVYLNERRGDCKVEEGIAKSGAGLLWAPLRIGRL